MSTSIPSHVESEFYSITGEVVQIHEIRKITAKLFKSYVEILQADGENHTVDAPRWHLGSLAKGQTYELLLRRSGYDHDDVQKVTLLNGIKPPEATPKPPEATPKAPEPVASAPTKAPATKTVPDITPRPDLSGRWREYNMHFRTAEMQATEFVKILKELATQGFLVDDEGNKMEKIRKSTIEVWLSNAVDRYFKDLDARTPYDAFSVLAENAYAHLLDDENAS